MSIKLSVFLRGKCIFCRGTGYECHALGVVCYVCEGRGWSGGVYYPLDTMDPDIWRIWEEWTT